MGQIFLMVKRAHYSLDNNKWGDTHDTPAIEQLILCKKGTQMSTNWLFIKNSIAHVQPINVPLSWSFFRQNSFSLKGPQHLGFHSIFYRLIFAMQLRTILFCLFVYPSFSSGWRYGMNGNSDSCRQPN